jgi:predicted nucleotidyltransferase
MDIDNYHIQQLKESLKELKPHLALLFGSYVYGNLHRDSDIDLMVVTEDEFMPQTFKERTELYITVSEHILPVSKQIPIDLIVYTKPMYQQFLENDSSFSKEILSKGVILYESKHTTMA